MKNRYESELMQVLHEEMQDMHRSGFISDAEMREFDELCLEPETLPDNAQNINIEHAELVTA